MSYSTSACFDSALSKPKRSSRKSSPQNFLGGAAIACLVLGSAWTVYTNVFRADVYPTLDSANFDAPLVKRSAAVAAREPQTVVSDAFAALREQAPPVAKPVAACACLDAVVRRSLRRRRPARRRARAASPDVRVAEAPKPSSETSKLAAAAKAKPETPKLAEAPKPKAAAPVQVAALPPQRPVETPEAKSPASAVRDMAQRAKAAVMSLASSERHSITEKLWGKEPSHGSLMAYASADASVTGSLGQDWAQPKSGARRIGAVRSLDRGLRHFRARRFICPTAASSRRIRVSAPSSTIPVPRASGCAA